MTTRDVLWSDITDIHAAILAHPFVTGLVDGTLPRESFHHYVVQDAHYLRGYARSLALCAAKAPDEATTVMFAEHAAGAIAAERDLHASLLDDLGPVPASTAGGPVPASTAGGPVPASTAGGPPPASSVAPATRAYVSYLLATAHGGSFVEALGAVLPCYWIYARVGEELLAAGSPDPLYSRWINMYGGPEYQAVVDAVLDVTDRVGAGASEGELARMREHFTTTARYEWMFWDAAYRREVWPI